MLLKNPFMKIFWSMNCNLSEIPKLKLSGEPTLAPWQSMHYCYRNTTLPVYSLVWLKVGAITTDSNRNISAHVKSNISCSVCHHSQSVYTRGISSVNLKQKSYVFTHNYLLVFGFL